MAHDGVVLEIDSVSKSFGALAALSKVSFAVRRGQVFSVIGPNGAGKSTLFNVVSGLHTPTAGRVRFNGQQIGGLGTLVGPILGGVFFTLLRDKVSSVVDWYFIVIGVVLVLIVLFMPKGLLGLRRLVGSRPWRQAA